MEPQLFIYIALCWWLFFWPYRQYRLDYFRLKLFMLRDELFDMAANDQISFDHPAYQMLRESINSNIRFGHKHGLLDLVCHIAVTDYEGANEVSSEYREMWEASLDTLDEDLRGKLARMRSIMAFEALKQVTFTSAILTCTFMTLLLGALLWVAKTQTVAIADRLLQNTRLQSYFFAGDSPAVKHA